MRDANFNHPIGASHKLKTKEAGASRLLFVQRLRAGEAKNYFTDC